jgi:beta-lactamase regulating signal transducer with metallopeptidase domain
MQALIDIVPGRLLAASIHATLLTALVWGLCRCLPRLPPAAQCWLWWLVALQAVVGLCMQPLQLPWLPAATPAIPEVASVHWAAIPVDASPVQPLASEDATPWPALLFLCWAGGLAAMGWLTLRQWHRMRALLRASVPCEDALLLQSLALAAASTGLRRAPRLHLSCDIDSPMLVGHFHPVLLLPTGAALSAAELDMAIAHELTHLRRGDLWWGWMPALARHLFFFHPLVHFAVREYGIAREADCDATVVAVARHSRRDYGDLLLRLGTHPGSDVELTVASPTFHALSKRLTMLQNTTFLSRTGSLAMVVLVAVTGVLPLRLVAAAATPAAPAANPAPSAAPRTNAPSAASPAAPKGAVVNAPPAATKTPTAASTTPAPARAGAAISNINFNRTGPDSTGRLTITVDDARIPVNLAQQGNRIVVDFPGTDLPENLRRNYQVAEFGTVVIGIDAKRTASRGAQLVISTKGDFDHTAYWAGGQYVLEIKPRGAAGVPVAQPVYTGERMTANFQDIDVRTLLKLIADTSGRNILVHDAVAGSITLRISSVPWDQLLDIVLNAKGLEKRVQGEVIWVFPLGEQGPAQKVAAPTPAAPGGPAELMCSGGCRVSVAPGLALESSAGQITVDQGTGITRLTGGVSIKFESGSELRAESVTIAAGANGTRELSSDEVRIVRPGSL